MTKTAAGMSGHQTSLEIAGPWAGMPIAWMRDEQFDEAAYRAALDRCCAAGVPGVYTGGTTGEFYALSFEEFQHVTRATVEQCHRHGVPAMIGVTAAGTREVIRRAVFAVECDADMVQLSLPFWIALTDDEVVRFFGDLSRAIDPTPFSIYDTSRAKRTLDVTLHQRVKDAAPAYRMVKSIDGTAGATPEGCAALSRFVRVFVSETKWDTLGPVGASGSCSAMVYWNPKIVLDLWADLQAQNWGSLRERLRPVHQLHTFLFEQFQPRGFTDTAYDRMMAEATGFIRVGLQCRAPYSAATPEDVQKVRQWLADNLPQMLEV